MCNQALGERATLKSDVINGACVIDTSPSSPWKKLEDSRKSIVHQAHMTSTLEDVN
jgi:hypothetical protein